MTETDVTKLDETKQSSAADFVINDLLAGSQKMLNKFEAYTEEELLRKIPSDNMVQSRCEFILHVINHSSYHRGQIVIMSRYLVQE